MQASVLPVGMHLVGHIADGLTLEQGLLADVIDGRSRFDDSWPANEARHAIAAFPMRVLLAAERRARARSWRLS